MAYDLDTFFSLPRAGGLALSPAGDRLATTVSTVAPGGKKMRSALWELDPAGGSAPRRLTWSSAGESSPVFRPDGSLLFVSPRPDPSASDDNDPTSALWCLPASGGEAFLVAESPGGIEGIAVARDTGRVALAIRVLPGADTLDEDREQHEARENAGVTAQLFDRYPIRFWDHYLGPRDLRYFVADPTDDGDLGDLRQVASPERFLDQAAFDLSPDGATLFIREDRNRTPTDLTSDIVAIDVRSGRRRVLTDGPFDFGELAASPDGRHLAAVRGTLGTPETPGESTIWLIDLDSGDGRDITPSLDRSARDFAWSADGKRLFFVADDAGHAPLFSVTVAKRPRVTRLTESGSHSSPQPTPGGTGVLVMRSHVDHPATAIHLPLDDEEADTASTAIPTPGAVKVPGRLRNVKAKGVDDTPLRSWLVLPKGASRNKPAPLVVWVHGGPRSSWNDWSWRWNPWLLAERGYAVLLPDPALSTGYGSDFIARGWGRWGDAPFTDVMAATDAACKRADIDDERVALMGGSFGGYMANWIAGHTDRYRCIVTHASLWALDQFHGTTDAGFFWELEFGDPYGAAERYHEWSPHRHVANISTPMLVIHGELDHRVPIGEALRLWTDLRRHDVESQFLYFPDENHWILKPQNARLWYETVFAWLDHHVLGNEWTRPNLL